MKKSLAWAIGAAIVFSSPAIAWEGRTIACYDNYLVPARYAARKVLVRAARKQYEHRNGRTELVWYPAVYREALIKISEEHYVMRQITCHHGHAFAPGILLQ